MIHQADGGREEEWAGHQQGHEASDPARSNGPYETCSHKDSGEEAELIMSNGDENSSIRRERREERCSVYPKRPPAANKPIAASLGAGPGEPDSALTISSVKEESLKSNLK